MFGGPGEENLRKNLPSQIEFYKKQLKELLDARKLAEGKTKGESALTPSSANPEADKRASAFLDAVERREQSIADARQGYEKEIASIRENAIKQAEALERRYQDQRLQDERELGRVRRDLAAAAQEENLLTRGISGEDPALLDQERKIGDAIRQYTEDKISREEQAQDRQIGLSRELEDFKRQNADAINKANERYANAIGKIQQEYAKSVAKIIEDGSGSGAKKLAAAGKIVASLLSQAAAQQTFQQVTGIPIRPAVNGVEAGGRVFQDKSGLAAAVLAGALQAGQDVQTINTAVTAAKNYFDAVAGSRNAQRELNKELAITAKIQPTKMPSVDTGDIESSIQEKQQALTKSLGQINNEKDALSKQKNIYNELLGAIKDAGDEVNANKRQIDDQNSAIEDQLQLIRNGMLPALAEEELTRENIFDKWRKYAQQGADQILKATTNKEIQENVLTILQEQLNVIANQETAYAAAQSVLRDNAALLDAAKIEEQTRGVGRGLGAGFINEAGAAYEEQISKGVSPEAAASVARATEQLTIAKGAVDALQSSINGIGAAFGEAMTTGVASLISGTATAKEVFASFLQSVGQALSQAASQMIATYIAIGIAKLFAGLGGASSDMSKTGISESTLAPMRQYQMPVIPNANGNVLKGGFKAFANGGVVSGPTLGLVGEGKYNEAIVPLPDGRSIPVTMNGGQSSRNLLSNGAAKRGSSPILSMSFQSTTINGVEYVDRAQLEAAMAETRRLAARDGASQGSQLALNKIKNSPTTRRQLGF
jgi:hypothetical protein